MNHLSPLPKRKHPRLSSFDYDSAGSYFITICTQNRRCVLSRMVEENLTHTTFDTNAETVQQPSCLRVKVEYTPFGKIAEEQLLDLEKRFPSLSVDRYVIMPNHIHVILTLRDSAGASPRPTVMDVISAFKSLTTRKCKALSFPSTKLFQTSFYDHVIRDREDYEKHVKYIWENPDRWYYDELYTAE